MADDWDLQAVVRSCSTASATSSFTTTAATSGLLPHENDHILIFSDPLEPRSSERVEELQDLLKPFFPQFRALATQNGSISSLSVLGDLQDLAPPQQEQKQQYVISSRANIATTAVAISHGPSSRSKKRKNQMKRICEIPVEGLSCDMWSWRKYGQKPIKGSPYPRGYYRCSTSKGCLARKQVERKRSDPGMFIVAYTAEHNHPIPTHRNSIAGINRQKPVTTETVTAGETLNKPYCSHPVSPVESREELEDLMEGGEDDLGVSDMVINDDFFEGLDEISGLVTGDFSDGHFYANFPVHWLSNNATTTAGGG